MHQQHITFENIVGKEEIDRNEQFLLFSQCFLLNQITVSPFVCNEQFVLFPQCFIPNQITVSPFVYIFDVISLFAAELEEPKIAI